MDVRKTMWKPTVKIISVPFFKNTGLAVNSHLDCTFHDNAAFLGRMGDRLAG